MKSFTFTVPGEAEPAGSKRAFVPLHPKTKQPYRRPGGGIVVSVVDANPRSGSWKKFVAKVAEEECGKPLLEGPLKVTMIFYRPRPQSHLATSGLSKHGRETPLPITKPDAGKLARGTIDAMTGVIYRDDAQIVEEVAIKRYGTPPRAEITVEEVIVPEPHEQGGLFATLDPPAPWERAATAAGLPQTADHTEDQADDAPKKRATSDGDKSRSDRSHTPDQSDERPPWEAQEQTVVKKAKNSRQR